MSKELSEKTKEKTYKPGDLVIVATGQCGTIWYITDKEIAVLLANLDIWYGPEYEVRFPSSEEELKACPKDVGGVGKRNGNYSNRKD